MTQLKMKMLLGAAAVSLASISSSVFAIGGVNLSPSYTNGGNVGVGWGLMSQQTKIKAVRVEVDPKGWNFSLAAHGRIIQEAINQANITKIIVTYHDSGCLGCDDTAKLTAAATWLVNNKAALHLTDPKVRINLFNEWGGHQISSTAWANAVNSAVKIIRAGGLTNRLIADVPGLGQESIRGANGIKLVTDTNVVPSMHLYGSCYDEGSKNSAEVQAAGLTASDVSTLGQCQTKYMNRLIAAGRGFLIGEYGTRQSGNSDSTYLGMVTTGRASGDVYAWAWNGDGGSMSMVGQGFKSYQSGNLNNFVNGQDSYGYTLSGYFNEVYPYLP